MSTRITKQRIRITFGKTGSLRFIGHLDMAKMWERVLRRAQLPVEYSQGFNRRPRTQFASPLSLGFTSEAELLDVWLDDVVMLDAVLLAQLAAVSPADLKIYNIESVPIDGTSLPALTDHSVYHLMPAHEGAFPADIAQRLQTLLESEVLPCIKKEKPFNFRPLLLQAQLLNAQTLEAILTLREGATGRPQDFINLLGMDELAVRVHRVAIGLMPGATSLKHQ